MSNSNTIKRKLPTWWLSSVLFFCIPSFGQNEAAKNPTDPPITDIKNTETSKETKPVRPNLPTHLLTREADIIEQLTPEQCIWLPSEAAENKSLAVWQKVLSGDPKGAVLMMHGGGQDLLWPNALSILSQYLAKQGWASLIVSAPSLPKQLIPLRSFDPPSKPKTPKDKETAESQPEAGDIDETKVVFEEESKIPPTENPTSTPAPEIEPPPKYADLKAEAISTLQLAMNQLHQKGQYNIALLGEGMGAEWILAFNESLASGGTDNAVLRSSTSTAKISNMVRAVIVIDAHQSTYFESLFDTSAPKSEPLFIHVPTLDLFINDFQAATQAAKQRKIFARSQKVPLYQQKGYARMTNQAEDNALNKRVRGFLDKHAAGSQMK